MCRERRTERRQRQAVLGRTVRDFLLRFFLQGAGDEREDDRANGRQEIKNLQHQGTVTVRWRSSQALH